ncbi:MAG: cadherin-like domain-containing protein, partial [Bacteroidota bacterium]
MRYPFVDVDEQECEDELPVYGPLTAEQAGYDLGAGFLTTIPPRDCDCAPIYKDSNFSNPHLIDGHDLEVGAVYRFANVFPSNPFGTTIDALVRIEEFSGGASLLEIDVTSSGLPEAFQPRINSTNSGDQSVLFSMTFVEDGGNYGDEVEISVFGTPLDIDGDGVETREYAEVNLPDAYFINNNTVLNIFTGTNIIRGETSIVTTAPGDDVSLDPRFTFSNYWENVTSVNYRIGKLDGDDDRYYSFNLTCADYDDPNSVFFTYPAICGNVSDQSGDPLANVEIEITGDDGSSQTVQTDAQGNYKGVAEIPEDRASVTYEIRETDLAGYISISDVDGANDNLITREIELASSCGNDFVDGFEGPTGWTFECGDDKIVDEIGYNANCQSQTVASIPDPSSVYQYVVEIVYKGNNPGQSIEIEDAGGTIHTLLRSVPVGTSSNIWVYRGLILGGTASITYEDNSTNCRLQSVVIYAFRNAPGASSSSGVFTSRSGVNDIQTITIDVPSYTAPRDLIIETPISEMTDDGRYLLLRAEAGGISDQVFLYGPDNSLPGGTCCLAIPTLTLSAVPGNVTQVTITVDTRNNQNGQSVNGQSWVIASGVNVDGDCPDPNSTYAFNDFADTLVNTPVMGNVLTNDVDLEGDNQVVTNVGTFPTTQGGSITIAADGSYTYTPPADFLGVDTFEYFIEDDGVPTATDSATLFINVVPPLQNTTTANPDNAETY